MTTVTSSVSSGVVTARQPAPDAAKASLDYSAFLRLFVASMKNQDPTKPNDPSQTLSQLASFSNVEQSIKLNEKLDHLVASSTASVAASMVGRLISSLDGTVSGLVTDVESGEAGLVAVLEDGSRLEIAQGYRIRAA
jgi:flagellar basal-body rod modification protein FlgD